MEQRIYTASTTAFMVCPACGISRLHRAQGTLFRCGRCESTLGGTMLETLRQIAALPDAIGSRPCECGHPEMKSLPDGVSHCRACGSEVLPLKATPISEGSEERGEAYLCGWSEGFFGSTESFVHNTALGRWEDAADRLHYYRGHRAGRAARF